MRAWSAVFAMLAVAGGGLAICAVPREATLGAYSTSLAERSTSQRHNAQLSLSRLVGAEIPTGATFSFNQRVGTFSRDQGYRKAPVSYNGQLIDDWGGGVCQTSTTLYNAALLAGMRIVERNRHRFQPSYVPPGRDAAVAFSNIDLRFTNPYSYPVRIEGTIAGSRLEIRFVAPQAPAIRPEVVSDVHDVQSPETFVLGAPSGRRRVRNTGKSGFEVSVYRITGPRRELISHDNYPAMNRVVEVR
ncbi:VanW family protein [Fimbriimonas ginsengisoli]|uniref:VanW family protein n=1 Tax=Fimbriimonas ginsengisoli Gsoil 348 TaxID=661478 RepID=A0A068NLX9_FIMGI|nr:VanW family protein [Fimbriimonas ginsengisoli]AIE84481.1 VanW family protein [Fimbriimonas ginsengisoli Gsoil 348]